ncbi:hypothetical protein BDQ12DRAFT_635350 [Crucibulum laeve]|uniref:FAD/NAD(P)-binding domain-containing protein n=1 Tax=Crucibulum laeve TaxID=68775 RepID=A0A5C3LRY5_9AGAR|nr:hypothetical protein BDQ12DRAFT_635350 [Crucibulum laeve]
MVSVSLMSPQQSSHPSEYPLPTFSKLGVSAPQNPDALKTASSWLAKFDANLSTANVEGVLGLFIHGTYSSVSDKNDPSALSFYWRDILALTWDFRTFEGTDIVRQFLVDRLSEAKISNLRLKLGADGKERVDYQQPYDDLAWIHLMFTFETAVGIGSGIVRLVPTPLAGSLGEICWKAHSVFTNLEDLKGFPEKIGNLRNRQPKHGRWVEERERERQFVDNDPTVLIIGGGQAGLEVSARLKCLAVPTLIIEKNARIGDNWRNRYEALCLHDLIWYDHMPYLPFPPTWPVFTPAKKLANWLESYAESMELNVWTSSTVLNAKQDEDTQLWSVIVKKPDGTERIFTVKHVVFAIGFKGGKGHIPKYPGMEDFQGHITHSLHHGKADQHIGKKVLVVGACASAHDICADLANHGIDVTMYQRSSTFVMSVKNGSQMFFGQLYGEDGPPTDEADRIFNSFPNLLNIGMAYRLMKQVKAADKDMLDGLHARGFRTNGGIKDAGPLLMVWSSGGGFYLNNGGSDYIIDGRVKIKNDAKIEKFTEKGVKFDNGSELEADVVVFATGLGHPIEGVRDICGDEVADGCKSIWGLNSEGETSGIWRDMGYKGLWYMMGNLAMCRFHSKHLALQIKAMEEGVFGERYSLED